MRYLEVADLKTAGELPMDFDLVAISSFSAQVKEGYELAERYLPPASQWSWAACT